MPCNCSSQPVMKTPATMPLFQLTRDIAVGDEVDVTMRGINVGAGVVRRVYLRSNVEYVDVFLYRTRTVVTVVTARGDAAVVKTAA